MKTKRIFDFLVSSILFVILAPLFAVVAVFVRICLGSPVIFRQKRPGLNGNPFVLLKFRSMMDLKNKDGRLLPDHERLTKFSRLLRESSLDELPSLLNVMKGDMSLVGPRPLLMKYLNRYNPEQARRHDVKPGITGWAQVNGRNAVEWADKFKMDVWYVDHQNFCLDIKILFITVLTVLKREGISQEGHVTSEEFMGNDDGKGSI